MCSESIRVQNHPKIPTRDNRGEPNGYLVPIYNVHDAFFAPGAEPKQVYLTVILPGTRKGPHLHYIRTGFFTCIRGNVKVVVKIEDRFVEFFSGEDHEYRSVEVPAGRAAMLVNVGPTDALVLNMPNPAWTPEMNDEHTADFSHYEDVFKRNGNPSAER